MIHNFGILGKWSRDTLKAQSKNPHSSFGGVGVMVIEEKYLKEKYLLEETRNKYADYKINLWNILFGGLTIRKIMSIIDTYNNITIQRKELIKSHVKYEMVMNDIWRQK